MLSVIIIGGGYGGAYTARALDRRADVTLIGRDNFLLFTPMLAEVAAAEIDPRHITAPLRQLCPHAHVVQGEVVSVDLAGRAVTVQPPLGRPRRTFTADAVVLAAGSEPNDFGVPGVDDWTLPFKTIGDALRIRNRLITLLETGAHEGGANRIAIVGAGYSGAELAAALADFVNEAVPRFYRGRAVPSVSLVDGAARITPTLPERLSLAAATALEDRGVELALGRNVAAVDAGGLEMEGGGRIEADTVIWAAGVTPAPLPGIEELATDRRGRIAVDSRLQAEPGVFALGDLAAVPDGFGGVSPTTAQHAIRQGNYLGRHLPAIIAGRSVRDFKYRTKGELVSLGRRNAVGKVLGRDVSGFVGWFLWRGYYLLRLPTFLRKARVAVDWSIDLLFPPDIAMLPTSDLGPVPPEDGH